MNSRNELASLGSCKDHENLYLSLCIQWDIVGSDRLVWVICNRDRQSPLIDSPARGYRKTQG